MKKETYDLLVESLEKWRKNASGPANKAKVRGEDCPLCREFYGAPHVTNNCEGCPVREATGVDGCRGTPWTDAYVAHRQAQSGVGTEAVWREAAQREADFLAALVPAGGPDAPRARKPKGN